MKSFKVFLALILLAILIFSINVNTAFVIKDSSNAINAYNNNNLIRLHVIADTNSPLDQYLKRVVRDEVHHYIGKYVQDELTINLLQEELANIKSYVQTKLLEKGYDHNIEVEFGQYNFPTRTYGELTLAAGEYKALKISIGQGKGANWWCVLLPPLCIDIIEQSEETEDILEKSNFVKREDIIFQFKILEIWEESKIKEFIAKYLNQENINLTMFNLFNRKEDLN